MVNRKLLLVLMALMSVVTDARSIRSAAQSTERSLWWNSKPQPIRQKNQNLVAEQQQEAPRNVRKGNRPEGMNKNNHKGNNKANKNTNVPRGSHPESVKILPNSKSGAALACEQEGPGGPHCQESEQGM